MSEPEFDVAVLRQQFLILEGRYSQSAVDKFSSNLEQGLTRNRENLTANEQSQLEQYIKTFFRAPNSVEPHLYFAISGTYQSRPLVTTYFGYIIKLSDLTQYACCDLHLRLSFHPQGLLPINLKTEARSNGLCYFHGEIPALIWQLPEIDQWQEGSLDQRLLICQPDIWEIVLEEGLLIEFKREMDQLNKQN